MINYVRRCDALAQRLPHKRSAEDLSEQGVIEVLRKQLVLTQIDAITGNDTPLFPGNSSF